MTWTLIKAGRHWEALLTDVLAPHGLTPVQYGLLAHLAAEPGLTQAELARRVLMRPQSMSYLLDGLVERGLVDRVGERGSGRANPIELTDSGADLLAGAWPVVKQVNSPAALGISPRRLAGLHHRGGARPGQARWPRALCCVCPPTGSERVAVS